MTEVDKAVEIVSKFLEASMIPDPDTAATYMDNEVKITFTGRREMENAQAITAFNQQRYQWVKRISSSMMRCRKKIIVWFTPSATCMGNGKMVVTLTVTATPTVLRCVMGKSPKWMYLMTALSGS